MKQNAIIAVFWVVCAQHFFLCKCFIAFCCCCFKFDAASLWNCFSGWLCNICEILIKFSLNYNQQHTHMHTTKTKYTSLQQKQKRFIGGLYASAALFQVQAPLTFWGLYRLVRKYLVFIWQFEISFFFAFPLRLFFFSPSLSLQLSPSLSLSAAPFRCASHWFYFVELNSFMLKPLSFLSSARR